MILISNWPHFWWEFRSAMGIPPFPFLAIVHKRKLKFKKWYLYQTDRIFYENSDLKKFYAYISCVISYSYIGIILDKI
jgi:hypothetical protein